MELRAPKTSKSFKGQIKFLKTKITVASEDGDVYDLGYEDVAPYCEIPKTGTFNDVIITLSNTGNNLKGVRPADGDVMATFDSIFGKDGVPQIIDKPGFSTPTFTIPPGKYFRMVYRVAAPKMEWMTVMGDLAYKFVEGDDGGAVYNRRGRDADNLVNTVESCGISIEELYVPYGDDILSDLQAQLHACKKPKRVILTLKKGFVKDVKPVPMGM